MIDAYLWGDVNRISPEAPVPVIQTRDQEKRLGGAANVAINLQALGAQPFLCSVIGTDSQGDDFIELLYRHRLPSEGILRSDDRQTTTKTRVIAHNQHLLRIDREMEHNLDADTETEFIRHIEHLFASCRFDAVVFEDYDKGIITQEVIRRVVALTAKSGIPTLVDPKKRNFLYYKGVSLFKPNFKELKEGLNLDIRKADVGSLANAAKILHTEYEIKCVLTTLSEQGVFVSHNGKYNHIPAEIRDIADVSGAGDTVISVACVCLASGIPPDDIARIANLAGGLVCEKVGVVPVNKDQLLSEALRVYSAL